MALDCSRVRSPLLPKGRVAHGEQTLYELGAGGGSVSES